MADTDKIFYLASVARSGTTYLRSLLASHPELAITGEILNPGRTDKPRTLLGFWKRRVEEDRDWLAPARYDQLAADYVREVIRKVPEGRRAVYDLKLEQLDRFFPWMEHALFAGKPSIIFLSRANLLKQSVSFFLMQQRIRQKLGEVHSSSVPEKMPLTIQPDQLLTHMRYNDRIVTAFRERAAQGELRVFHLTYEELAGNGDSETRLADLQDFLGVERKPLGSELAKQNPDPVEELVTNFSEVREAILRSEFAYTLFLPT